MSPKPILRDPEELTPVYRRYRQRLIEAHPGLATRLTGGKRRRPTRFLELARDFEAVFFDAYGVLNRGPAPIEGSAAALGRLRTAGVPFRVVSNNASESIEQLARKFRDISFDIRAEEIVTSGEAIGPFVAADRWRGLPYALVGTPQSLSAYAPDPTRLMVNHPGNGLDWPDAEYILMCSDRDYYGDPEARMEAILAERPRPVVLVNPDLYAPDAEGGIYAVAGLLAMTLQERYGVEVIGLGKPFAPVFELALERLGSTPPERVLMVGDTLETDILGAAAMGMATCLTLTGVHAAEAGDVAGLCARHGIHPDFVVDAIAQ